MTAAAPPIVAGTSSRSNTPASVLIGLAGVGLLVAALFVSYQSGVKILDTSHFDWRTFPWEVESLFVPVMVLVVLVVPMSSALRRGFLLGVGLQSVLLYIGFGFGPVAEHNLYGTHPGAGGFLGLAGALLVVVAAALATPQVGTIRQPTPTAAWTMQPAAITPAPAAPPVEPTLKSCPDCAEQVQAAAKVCRFCGYDFIQDQSGSKPSS
jgi:hypothetical protein